MEADVQKDRSDMLGYIMLMKKVLNHPRLI